MSANKLHRYSFIILTTLLVLNTSLAQKKYDGFDAAVAQIKKNIHCCSVSFTGSNSKRVTTVLLYQTGEITLVHNHNRPPISFNLFELYKNTKSPAGLYYQKGSKTIVFNIEEFNAQAIQFNSAAKAKETYDQFLNIIQLGKQ
jgi:hypothetical protein